MNTIIDHSWTQTLLSEKQETKIATSINGDKEIINIKVEKREWINKFLKDKTKT